MKITKILCALACVCALGIAGCSDDNSTNNNNNNSSTENQFSPKAGDRATYSNKSLDDNNNPITSSATVTTRTVVKLNVSIGGVTDAVMALDTTVSGSGTTVDTLYFRMANNSLYLYNFAQIMIRSLPSSISLTPTDPTPKWTKVAELKESMGSTYTSDTLHMMYSNISPVAFVVSGINHGKTDVTVEGKTYTVFHQVLTATEGTIGMVIPLEMYVGGAKTGNSPSTIIQSRLLRVTTPFQFNGQQQALTDFKAGN